MDTSLLMTNDMFMDDYYADILNLKYFFTYKYVNIIRKTIEKNSVVQGCLINLIIGPLKFIIF